MPAEKERFAVLDGMRGLAALIVISDHAPSALIMGAFPARALAVDFFFALSGFVLMHVYGQRLRDGMGAPGFMQVRWVRLFPLYLVGLVGGLALGLLYAERGWFEASSQQVWASAAVGLFFLPVPPGLSIWPDAPFPLNGPSWSLFFELLINLIFVLTIRWLSPLLCVAFMALGAALLVPTALTLGNLDAGFAWSHFIGGFARVSFGFFAGVLLYLMHERWRAPVLPAWAIYGALLLVFAGPAFGLWRPGYDLFAAMILCPALVWLGSRAQARGGLLRLSLGMGALSYGIYVLHVPLWGALHLGLEAFGAELPGVANLALTMVLAVTVAGVLHVAFDVPARRWLTRRFGMRGGIPGPG